MSGRSEQIYRILKLDDLEFHTLPTRPSLPNAYRSRQAEEHQRGLIESLVCQVGRIFRTFK